MTNEEIAEYVEQYPLVSGWVIEPGNSGMNNTTRMVLTDQGRYVLRIYNNHKDKPTVQLEHELLKALQHSEHPFQVPVPVANHEGDTVTVGPEGTLAAMYLYIAGERPTIDNTAHITSLGYAAAALTTALSKVEPQLKPIYQPYYKLEESYASLDRQSMQDIAASAEVLQERVSKFEALQRIRDNLGSAIASIEELPHQWIHGDLNFSNAVAAGDQVVGILDFEFSTIDVRAMELAVVIVDLITEDETLTMDRIRLFCEGYGSGLKLLEREINSLPVLLKLRMLDVTLHFASRWKEELDPADVLAGIVDQAHRVCEWVERNELGLKQLGHKLLGQNGNGILPLY